MLRRLVLPIIVSIGLLTMAVPPINMAFRIAPQTGTVKLASVTLFPIASTSTPPRTSASVSYSGSGGALFTVLSNTWATDSTSIVVTFAIQQSFDSGSTWQDMCSTQWSPNQWGKGGPPTLPSIQCTAEDVFGSRLLRAVLSATSPINVGISATVS